MNHLLLCVNNFQLIHEFIDFCNRDRQLAIADITTVMLEHKEVLLEKNINVIVLDININKKKALNLVKEVKEDPLYQNVKFILLCNELDSDIIQTMISYSIKSVLTIPHSFHKITFEIHMLVPNFVVSALEKKRVDYLTNTLDELGIPNHFIGFDYLKIAIEYCFNRRQFDRISMSDLYRNVARMKQTTASRVEKAIRSAVEQGYLTQHEMYFKMNHKNKKPTNTEFIVYLRNILIQMKEGN